MATYQARLFANRISDPFSSPGREVHAILKIIGDLYGCHIAFIGERNRMDFFSALLQSKCAKASVNRAWVSGAIWDVNFMIIEDCGTWEETVRLIVASKKTIVENGQILIACKCAADIDKLTGLLECCSFKNVERHNSLSNFVVITARKC